MEETKSKQFREQIRLLERKLGLLKKSNECGKCKSITLAQCHALVEIGRAGTLSLRELATILTIDVSTTSRTVDSLVKNNYVCREASSSDRRSVNIYLTECGKNFFCNIESNMDSEFSKVFLRVPEERRQQVIEVLDLIINAF